MPPADHARGRQGNNSSFRNFEAPLEDCDHAQAGLLWTAYRVGTFPAMDAVRVPAVTRYPSRASLLTEPPRAGLDVAALAAAWPLLATARRGDGHPVLVLPGLM